MFMAGLGSPLFVLELSCPPEKVLCAGRKMGLESYCGLPKALLFDTMSDSLVDGAHWIYTSF